MPTKVLSSDIASIIVKEYQKTYSVSEVMKHPNLRGIGRIPITRHLKELGLYEGISGQNQQKKKQEKIQNTMMSRYGVINNGQRDNQGFSVLNRIPYTDIKILSQDYQEYRKKVDKFTGKTVSKMKLPEFCFYTKVRFADAERDKVNPNDQRKRTVDHKIPVIVGYLQGLSPEEMSSTENITFVLRYVNTVKGNTQHNDFLVIAKYIQDIFRKEGFFINE